jgi:cytochrome bd-type quinol oxidase subunit 1
MILAAYLVTGFLIASVYAVGMLRGRRDRHHRLGLLIPLTVASILTPIQFAVATPPRERSRTTSRSSSQRWNACRRPRPT